MTRTTYLWNRRGPRDPFVVRLEQAMGPLRYQPRSRAPRIRRIAAAALLAAGVLAFALHAALAPRSSSESSAVARAVSQPTAAPRVEAPGSAAPDSLAAAAKGNPAQAQEPRADLAKKGASPAEARPLDPIAELGIVSEH